MTFKKNDLGNLEIDRLSDMESDLKMKIIINQMKYINQYK